ncbi:MAG: hypothetical protein H7248_11315 [Microbacteriaceae bacterium]|nr:hypothetical protein [Microbacteriaceae bacterium]
MTRRLFLRTSVDSGSHLPTPARLGLRTVDRGFFDNGQALQRRHTVSLVCGALTVAWAIVLIG